MANEAISGSFRDPDGFVFHSQGVLYRQVNASYRENYDHLIRSGLYDALIKNGLLVPHAEMSLSLAQGAEAYRVLRPERVRYLSYPFEWCFSQLKEAALLTLSIQRAALEHGMSLKDCSAYNVQFDGVRPVFIDTLSFQKLREEKPWGAYRQFCQHFLAPLALMSCCDIRLGLSLKDHLDGIPLDLASSLLPLRTYLRFGILVHIHMHAGSQRRYGGRPVKSLGRKMSLRAHLGLVDSLENSVKGLRWRPEGTVWAEYYENAGYSPDSLEAKKRLVEDFIERVRPRDLWDFGANTGLFSRIASAKGIPTVSCDVDPAAVEINYLTARRDNLTNILPLLVDLTNASPGIGWENAERMSFLSRCTADAAVALALVHHLAISNNLPLDRIARFFGSLCNWLIIEFVPKSDPQTQRLLSSREDIFPDYTREAFEDSFARYFNTVKSEDIRGTERSLYLMRSKRGEDRP